MKLAVAGKILTPSDAEAVVAVGVDVVAMGRAAILHHDYPHQLAANANFQPRSLPVSRKVLNEEGLSDGFVEYMKAWPGFVAD